jgi:RHS repeat-associated protein
VLYSYDDENRLIAVQQGADAWAYTYDAFSQRVAASHNGAATRFVVDPVGLGHVVGEYDATGGQIARYDFGIGLLSQTANGASSWYTFDALGSTAALSDASGNYLSTYSYSPFGAVLRESGGERNPFQYIGEWGVSKEGTGLDFMRARSYLPAEGRFVQSDPAGLLGGFNVYSYTLNNPIRFIDPLGLCSTDFADQFDDVRRARDKGDSPELRDRDHYYFAAETVAWWGRAGWFAQGIASTFVEVAVGGYQVYKIMVPLPIQEWIVNDTMTPASWGQVESGYAGVQAGLASPDKPFWLGGGLDFCDPTLPEPPRTPKDGGDGRIPGAVDPNQKLGPSGFGPAGYISPSTTLPYRIDFENDATATAPAQIVTITDQLDPDLDWSTFALTEIGFGDHLIAVPANAQHFETTVPVHYNGQDFDVQIEAGINLATGQVFAHFYSIDPNTSLPPDVLTGFLPPEDGTGRGMGHVSYLIDQKPGLATGTQIREHRPDLLRRPAVDRHQPDRPA